MTPEKLQANLNKLRNKIARKPIIRNHNYAKSIDESFEIYTRTSTINIWSDISELLWENSKWPFPLFCLNDRLVLGKILFSMIFSGMVMPRLSPLAHDHNQFKTVLARAYLWLFKLNKNRVFKYIKHNPTLATKKEILEEVHSAYNKKLWYACITSATPLLDFIFRQYFVTNALDRDIKSLLASLKKAQIITNIHIKPSSTAFAYAQELGIPPQQSSTNDLRLIGIALGSFLDFSNDYYDWFSKDKISDEFNRHAFLHGASNKKCTREDATKLIVFLDLTLRLGPVFKIILKED